MKLQATFKMYEGEQVISDNMRRELLRHMLEEEDRDCGVIRNKDAMELQLDYLIGIRKEPYWAGPDDFVLLNNGEQ